MVPNYAAMLPNGSVRSALSVELPRLLYDDDDRECRTTFVLVSTLLSNDSLAREKYSLPNINTVALASSRLYVSYVT
jgi:hypothetical protein